MGKNDFIRIAPTNSLAVTSRQDSSKHEYEQKKKRDSKKKDSEDNEKKQFEEFETLELIEYGKVIFGKRNKELKMFMKIYQEADVKSQQPGVGSQDEYNINDLSPTPPECEAIAIETVDRSDTQPPPTIFESGYDDSLAPTTPENDSEIEFEYAQEVIDLSRLLDLYTVFFGLVKDENKILNIDDIDFLEKIVEQKDDILNQITAARDAISFDIFKNLPPEDKNKIKANQILSEIHNVIDEIIKQEDENSVEFQNIREKMKLDIAKQDRGAKAVSQYAQSTTKSHFIDTKK